MQRDGRNHSRLALGEFTDVEGFMTGSLPEPVTVNLTYEGLKVVAEVSNNGDGYVLKVVKKASKKANIESSRRFCGRCASDCRAAD